MSDFIPIQVDHKPYKAPHSPMTGTQLKALAGVTGGYDLFFETPGPADDILIAADLPFEFKPGSHFYTIASTINPGGRDAALA